MSENTPPPRRRAQARGTRSAGPSLAPLPRLEVPWAPLEVLDAGQLERILEAAFRILEEAGIEIRHPEACGLYRSAGALVDADSGLVRIGREIVLIAITSLTSTRAA